MKIIAFCAISARHSGQGAVGTNRMRGKPDAIERGPRHAPMQFERRANLLHRPRGYLICILRHQPSPGKRVSRSLPGKKGSPRKLIAL